MIAIEIMSMELKSADQVLAEFQALGLSISEWARTKGYSAPLVYQILAGRKKCIRGQSHRIAVDLHLKEGKIGTVDDLFRLPPRGGMSAHPAP